MQDATAIYPPVWFAPWQSFFPTVTTCLRGPLPRRRTLPGATYELVETAQTSGATSD